jgi:large subunit ribosomal protein L22
MTKPGDPDKGKAAEAEQAEQAAKESTAAASQAAAEQAAEASGTESAPSGSERKAEPEASQAEGTAAEQTGVDKAGAEAAAVTEPEGDEPAAPAEPRPATERPEAPVEDIVAEEAPAPARRSRTRRGGSEPAAPEPTAAPTRRRDRRSGEQVIVRAHARYVRSSARKARLVADNVRGKSVADARALLAFSPRAVSEPWLKLLESAVANAENNHDLVGEDLKIHAIYADEGPTIKRYRPRAMGRATRIRKRTSHLTIQLTPKD